MKNSLMIILRDVVGMLIVTFLLLMLIFFVEYKILYTYISPSAGTIEEWLDHFISWAYRGVFAALFSSLLWYLANSFSDCL